MNDEKKLSRRELGARTARWFSLALLGGGAAFLWWRNGTTESCGLSSPCAACDRNDHCELKRETPDPQEPKRSQP